MATKKTREELVETAGAYFYSGNTPSWEEFQDLMASFLNFEDDRLDAIEADDATQTLWESVYDDLPDAPAGMTNNSLAQLINRLVTDQPNLLDAVEADIATNTADIATNTADIATNTADIATNTADVATAQASADAALPKAGGTLSGDIDCDDNDLVGIKTATFTGEYDALTSGAAVTIDFADGQNQTLELTANTTITLADPPGVGHYQLRLVQDTTGGRTVTWSGIAETAWLASATWPTINSDADGQTFVNLFWDGASWYGSAAKLGAT